MAASCPDTKMIEGAGFLHKHSDQPKYDIPPKNWTIPVQ